MTTRNTTKRPLTDLQQAILDAVWARGSATADEVRAALAPGRRLKDSTVRTLLRRLEARGFLRHRTEGKVYVYEAALPRTRVAARAVQQIIDRFWGGSAEQFLAGMVDARVLSEAEIKRLADKVKSRKKA